MRVDIQQYKLYLLLLSVHFGAMTTHFFLPTNRRLILELPKYSLSENSTLLECEFVG
jgi:hypothetical protein